MKHLLTCTAVALVLGLTPAIAADTSADENITGADTSTGAKEQSSAPQSSDAAEKATETESMDDVTSADDSSGAKEQSSAPEDSSAATDKPNPTIGSAGKSKSDTDTN